MKLRIDEKTILYFILIIVAGSGFFFTVFMPSPQGFYAFIAVAAFAGFCVSANIYDTKRQGKQLVCPTGSDCNAVVNSRYSRFFGISLEYWGMGYFGLVTLVYLMLIFSRELFTSPMVTAVVLLSVAAGLFSSYLLFVQAFLLRIWCIWCILTAIISLIICVMSLVSNEMAVGFLVSMNTFLVMIKFLGFAFGVGGSTAAVFLFGHFLEDANIDEKELKSIKDIFELVWVGFGLVLISQFALFISYPHLFAGSNAFIIQIISLMVFAFTAALLMIIYAPFLIFVPFQKILEGEKGASFLTLRSPTLTLGGVALVSWYFAFILNFVPELSFPTFVLLFMVTLLATALLASLWDQSLHNRQVTKQSKGI